MRRGWPVYVRPARTHGSWLVKQQKMINTDFRGYMLYVQCQCDRQRAEAVEQKSRCGNAVFLDTYPILRVCIEIGFWLRRRVKPCFLSKTRVLYFLTI